ncbi:hypothetical protein ACFL36_05315 [Thermodesulfobacteriota bacterium]
MHDYEYERPFVNPEHELLREISKPKDHFYDFAYIRRLAGYDLTKASLIISPISIIELFKINAEINFKQLCSEAIGAKYIQKMGVKQVGDLLSKLYSKAINDPDNDDLRQLIGKLWLNMSFAQAHGLHGIGTVRDMIFRLTEADVGRFLCELAFLQLDTTDILHLHTAFSLKCEYFATLDSGFSKNREIIEEETKIKLITSTKDLIKTLEKYRLADKS